jgi:hypothetical protein
MTALATNHDLLPLTTDTIIGGVSPTGGHNSWARKGAHEPEEPTRRSLSDPEQPWLHTVLQELRAVAALGEDWDSYGAGPIRRDVLWYALRLLQSVMDDFPAPQLTPMSHEGVLLEWLRDGTRLEIENEASGIDDSWRVRADFSSLLEPLRAIAGQTSASATATS